MPTYGNRVKVATATTGTGTVTLGSATSNAFCTFAEAGIANASTVIYCIEEGTDFEIGTGVYTSAGTTLTRATVYLSKISGSSGTTKMTLGGNATVRVIQSKEDILSRVASTTDNAAVRFDGTTGDQQTSALIIADTTGALSRSGGGGIPIEGTNTNGDASAGQVGEYVSSAVASGSAVALTTATPANITTISLTAGDWDVYGQGGFIFANTTTFTILQMGINTTSATLPASGSDVKGITLHRSSSFAPGNGALLVYPINTFRLALNATTTVYLVLQATFATSTLSGYGFLAARRVR